MGGISTCLNWHEARRGKSKNKNELNVINVHEHPCFGIIFSDRRLLAGKMMSGNGVQETVHNLALEGDLEAVSNK